MLVIVKIGGSSITIKSQYETLNHTSLEWMTRVLQDSLEDRFLSPEEEERKEEEEEEEVCKDENECVTKDIKKKKKVSMVIIHGAGSFGHHTAKQYGLVGRTTPPPPSSSFSSKEEEEEEEHRYAIQGLVRARHSVQKLNSHILSSLLSHNIHAINMSPCWSVHTLQSHGGSGSVKEEEEEEENGIGHVVKGIQQALSKGIIPILHGDACPYGDARGRNGVGILSGDTLVEAIATHWNEEEEKTRISHVVFVTDIDKVYTSDPKVDADAKPLDVIEIDGESGDIVVNLDKNEENSGGGDDDDDDGVMIDAGESLHDHDVTGGLKTKLGAAASIATKGIPVHIVQCGSKSAERAILGEDDNGGTVVRLLQ